MDSDGNVNVNGNNVDNSNNGVRPDLQQNMARNLSHAGEVCARCKGTGFLPGVTKKRENTCCQPGGRCKAPFPCMGMPGGRHFPWQPKPNQNKGGDKLEEYERVYCFESLYQAHKKARLGKQDQREVIQYECCLTENLQRLSWYLKNKTYRVRGYHRFIIHDPKTREIQALSYGDRVVQHSLCDNVLGPYLERHLVYDNAACRTGKGTHFAMGRLSGFLRDFYRKHGTDGYILKCDIRKYFDSISHEVLKGMLCRTQLSDDTK